MRNYAMVICVAALMAVASIAVGAGFTWVAPLPSAADGTLGANQKLEKQKAVNEEIRTNVDALKVAFDAYTSAQE